MQMTPSSIAAYLSGRLRTTGAVVAVGSLCALASCSTGQFSSPLYLAVTISPRPASIAPGASVTLKATVSNDLSLPTWSILDSTYTTAPGVLTAVAGDATSILYTAPGGPPIYNGVAALGFTQGAVTVQATVNPPAGSTLPVAHDSITVVVTAASISVAIAPATIAVPLGGTQVFTAYAVGSVNNALIFQVNGVAGGSPSSGTITAGGVYTAPAAAPMTGAGITITAVSVADPTRTASAVVTLQ